MFLSRLKLNTASRAVRRDLADCQQMHRTIMSVFPQVEGAARMALNVLFRVETSDRESVVYVQSRVQPDWTALPPGYCLPGGIGCKAVAEQYAAIADGMVLRFRLRANPTKRLKAGCPGEKRDGARVELRRESDQLAWLARKAEAAGCALLDVQVGVPAVTVVLEPGRVRGRHPAGRLTFGAVVFEGRLRVENAARFRQALAVGVGTGRAYGFGLISVAPGM